MNTYKKRIALACAAVFLLVMGSGTVFAQNTASAQYWPAGPEIASAAGIVIEAETGTILYEKNMHGKYYPASITKILTALLAIENCDLNEIVTFSHDSVYKTEGSGIARDVGEEMTMEQCLYAVMLASSNESAYAVAEHVAGSMDAFIRMMNERAAAIGCVDSNFNNCHGLPDENHYTSAYDMALIAREAYKNDIFRIICGTKTYTIPFTNKHKDEETYLQNHHQMLYPLKTRKYLYEDCLGGKTGYTSVAGYTLVTYAERNGMTLICVVLNAPPGGSNYDDTRALFDFCFDNFKKVNVLENETDYVQPERKGAFGSYEPFVALDASASIVLPVAVEFADADSKIRFREEEGDVLGSICYTYADRSVGEADIVATNAAVNAFSFQENEAAEDQKEPKKEAVRIDIRLILAVLAGMLGIAGLGFLIYKFVDNFYQIKRRLGIGMRERTPYKTIKDNRRWRKRRSRWF